jgi:DNA invertase Pin-like site-specific DNA recombinase
MSSIKRRVVRGSRPHRVKRPAPPPAKAKVRAAKRQSEVGAEEQQIALAARLCENQLSGCTWAYVRWAAEAPGRYSGDQCAEIQKYCKEYQLGEPEFVYEVSRADQPILPATVATNEVIGASISPRPLLLMLLGHISARPGTNLVVASLDRLSRIVAEQEILLDILKRKNVITHSAAPFDKEIIRGDVTSNKERTDSRSILRTLAQYERGINKFRMRTGIRIKEAKGEWIGGHKPFGYDIVNADLHINEQQAQIVRWIFYWRDQFDHSYAQIAAWVSSRFKQKDWHKVRISRIVTNRELYTGVYKTAYSSTSHKRDDLRILPTDWAAWAAENVSLKGVFDEQA